MAVSFLAVFGATFLAVSQIAIIVIIAWTLVARGVIGHTVVKGLSDVTVLVFLPCLMFSNITETLKPGEQPLWWVIPLIGVGMFVGGSLIALAVFARDLKAKRDLIPLSAMQNAAFAILPIGQVLVPQDFDRFALYTFLYLLFFSPLFWSVGKTLTTAGQSGPLSWKSFVTPPTGARSLIPGTVASSVKLLGSATIPVATFVLGGSLGGLTHRFREHLSDAVRSLGVKLVIIPLLTVLVMAVTDLRRTDPTLALMLVLQGASAPATNIILQLTTYGGNLERSGTIILLGYIGAAFAMPFWVAVWQTWG